MPSRLGFDSPHPVAVSQVAGGWQLVSELIYHGTRQDFTVPVGQTTDFASIPAVLNWLVPAHAGIPAAVFHDWLWRCEVPAGRLTYRDADGLLRQALGTLGVPLLRRWMMFTAVRWGSLLTRRGGHRGWWRDAPTVLTITALAGPLVLPLAVLNTAGLGVYLLAESVVSLTGREPAVVADDRPT